ncbi:MAG: D-alanyl-D-alanine carboxypeptidase family protein [Candidatus Methylomirabilaceae bacterium]
MNRPGRPNDSDQLRAGVEGLSAGSAVLMDFDSGEVLFAKNARERRAPASTTKIMTALLVLEEGRLDDSVVMMDRSGAPGGARLGLKRGQRISLEDLVLAMLLRSANDAASAAAAHVGETEERFVARMNERAISLGMEGTHFTNPHGLDDPDHYSTAHDLALLARYALRQPTFARIVQMKEAWLSIQRGPKGRFAKRTLLRTHNRLLGHFDGANGVKTGYTGGAGRCLVASASRGGRQLVAVLLNDDDRWTDAAALLEYGFAALNGHAPSFRAFDGSSGDVQRGEGG